VQLAVWPRWGDARDNACAPFTRADGRLLLRWSARLGGMTIAIREESGQPTITDLTEPLPDQAALLGVLNQRYLHLVPLLSVECRSV
jgi:hypothetical protein